MQYHEHRCSMCPFFCGCQRQLVDHLIRRHQGDKNVIVHCCGHACGASFRKLNSFKSHVARKHSNETDVVNPNTAPRLITNWDDYGLEDDYPDNEQICSARLEGAYLLKLGAGHRVSQTALDEIIIGTRHLLACKLQAVKNKVLPLSGLVDIPGIQECFNCGLFEGLESHHKQEQFFKKHFGLVMKQKV